MECRTNETIEETMQKTIEQHRAECRALFSSLEDKHGGKWAAAAIVGGIVAGLAFRLWVL